LSRPKSPDPFIPSGADNMRRKALLSIAGAARQLWNRPWHAPRHVLVFGDSHVRVFSHPISRLRFPNLRFHVTSVVGATASGLENPNSKTQAYATFQKSLEQETGNRRPAIVSLGEVDTGFVIWYRAAKFQTSVDEMLEQAVDRYGRLIREIAASRPTLVLSTPLPTIADGTTWGDVANARREVQVPQTERTRLTIEFNRRMAELARTCGADALNLDSDSLAENGLVQPSLLHPNPSNHHYDPLAYCDLIQRHLPAWLATLAVRAVRAKAA
jgi:hypothetical protein